MLRKVAIVSLTVVSVILIGAILANTNAFRAPIATTVARSREYQPGDTVIVGADRAHLRIGNDVIATLAKGMTMRVVEVDGQWVGGHVDVDGTTHSGWILATNIASALAAHDSRTTTEKTNIAVKRATPASPTSGTLDKNAQPADLRSTNDQPRTVASIRTQDSKSKRTEKGSSSEWSRVLAEMKRGKTSSSTADGGTMPTSGQPTAVAPSPRDSSPVTGHDVASNQPVVAPLPESTADHAPQLTASAASGTESRETTPAAPLSRDTLSGSTTGSAIAPKPSKTSSKASTPSANDDVDVQVLVAQSVEQIEQIDRSTRIGELTLMGNQFTDRSLKYLAGLNVRMLSINTPTVTNSGLKYLKQIQGLRFVRLWSPQFTDGALTHLVALKNLEILDLAGTSITGEHLDQLAVLPKLHELTLGPMTQDGALDQLVGYPALDRLDLRACKQLTEASFDRLARLKSLNVLWLPSSIAARGRSYFRKQLPGCHVY